ncbi:MAG: YncE family protein [Acidobacteriales bacterium]|nr:YncE family protein [Terriglobales bacterium]
MSFRHIGRLAAILAAFAVCVACGNTFRPVAVPEASTPPDPGSVHFIFSLTANAPGTRGDVLQYDVSGDSTQGVAEVGISPVHATLDPFAAHIFVVNAGEDTLASITPANVLGSIGTPVTISLPAGSAPSFVATTENGNVYVANSGIASVSAISITSNVVTDVIPTGNNPVALAETPNALSLYALNQADNTVTAINPADRTVRATIKVGVSPIWALSRADSTRVYVLNSGDGTISAIDTSTDQVVGAATVGVGANYMGYDAASNRLFVTNPVANTVTALLVASDPPSIQFVTPVSANPYSVTLLPDGSRLYVASVTNASGNATVQATVLNAANGSVQSVIPLERVPSACIAGAHFPVAAAAAGDGSRVYVSSCDSGSVSVISTTTDTKLLDLIAPASAYPPPGPGEQPPPQQPVFLIAGP